VSTEYELLRRHTAKGVETVELWEHSSVLDLVTTRDDTDGDDDPYLIHAVRDLTPEQCIALGLQALKVASYWMSTEDFKRAAANAMSRHGSVDGYLRDLLKGISA
jgi:hypothetical protein